MPGSPRQLRVFLASPGDVVNEREIALTVLDRLTYDPLLNGRITIQDVAWDKRGAGAPMLAGITPQDSITQGLARPSECDIVVVIFWSRMGTPLPHPEYKKADGSRYESGTEWEYDEAVQAFRKQGSPFVLLYRRTPPAPLNPDDPSLPQQLEQYEKVKRFFDSLLDHDGAIRDGFATYAMPTDFRERLEHDLKSLIGRILAQPASDTARTGVISEPWQGSPFPGLSAFTAKDAPIYFGRERELDLLWERIQAHPFVAVVGASGSGKSSLVSAGLIPRLGLTASATGSPPWITVQCTPDQVGSGDPFASLAAALQHALPLAGRKQLANALSEERDLLARLLREHAGGGRGLLFIDQFEELFTTIHPALRDPFVAALAEVARDEQLRTVITIRGDFYGRCVEQQSLALLIQNSTMPLSAPGVAALHDMIARPAARAALTFEDSLVQRILDDTGQEPGALALMAYTLDELYRRSSGGLLTHAAYAEIGGVQGAIGQRSEAIFSGLGDEERAALPRVFRELVDVDEQGNATRQRARLTRVAGGPAAKRLTDALTDARLLVQSRGDDGEPVVEVAHEALFRNWSRLAEWIADTQEDLRLFRQVRNAASEWNAKGRREDFLWSHERLVPVYALRQRLDIVFEPVVAEFIRPEYERIGERMRAETRDYQQRSYVARLIEIGPAAAGVLVGSLQYATTDVTRNDISAALAAMGKAAVPALIDACVAENFVHRETAIDTLALMKRFPDIDVTKRLLVHKDPAVRASAIFMAAVSGEKDLLPRLERCFKDPAPSIPGLATLAIASFEDDRAFDALASAVREHSRLRTIVVDLIRFMARGERMKSLTEAGGRYSKPLLALVEKNGTSLQVPRRTDALANEIVPLLGSGANDGVLRVLVALGNVAALRGVLNAMLGAHGSRVLKIIKRVAHLRMVPALVALLDDEDTQLREQAVRLVRSLAVSEKTPPEMKNVLRRQTTTKLIELTNDQNPEAALSALSALAAFGESAVQAHFRARLASKDKRAREIAIEGLGRSGDIAVLIKALRDRDSGARLIAARLLLEVGAAAQAVPEAMAILESCADSAKQTELKVALIHIIAAAPPQNASSVLQRVAKSKSRPASAAAKDTLVRLERSG